MKDIASYSKGEFTRVFRELVCDLFSGRGVGASKSPQAYLLGGQSGSGKTNLHVILRERLRGNAIVINGDEYRWRHPRYPELERRYGRESVLYTAAWAGEMSRALIDYFCQHRYNLIIEGTLRTTEVPLKTAASLKAHGYRVSLALMAVKPEISLISCDVRYEQMKVRGSVQRAVDPAYHAKTVNALVPNLQVLEKAGLFDSVELYNRGRRRLYPLENETRTASEALHQVLFGEWTAEEQRHYLSLQARLAALRFASG